MSNRRGNGDLASKGKANLRDEQLSAGVSEMSLGSEQDDGGQWEVYAKKSKNKGAASKPSAPQNSNSRAWGQPEVVQNTGVRNYSGPGGRASGTGYGGRGAGGNRAAQPTDSRRPAGRGNPRLPAYNRGFEQNQHQNVQSVARGPLEHGWNWQGRAGNFVNEDSTEVEQKDDGDVNDVHNSEEDEDDDDLNDDSEDELFSDDDDYDCGASKKSHTARKKNKWFRKFFEVLDELNLDQINDPTREWHCPACHSGPGAIDWYGMQPLITHAKTIGVTRVKLHRKFAEVLNEELSVLGATVIPSGGIFGKWKGLVSEEKDYEIVWPPMVVIMNTQLELDETDKWTGMGNQELMEYFRSYEATKARHAYGPRGHRGMSLLIFENSAKGYLEAERLHKHFLEERRDRDAWDRPHVVFYHSGGGHRQLYGYMAVKEDLDVFNRHSQGKAKQRFELRSYQEMVVSQIKQMSEDNQRLLWYKNKAAKEQMHSKAVEESFGQLTEKLKKTMEENIIVRQRSKTHHEQNKEELEFQAQFFKDQIQLIMEDRDAKEEGFEKQQQEKRHNANPSNNAEGSGLGSGVIKVQDKEREEFEEEREKLIKEHDERIAAMKKRQWEEEVELEKEYTAALTDLMKKYSTPPPSHASG